MSESHQSDGRGPLQSDRLGIGVIGSGRVGTVFASALRAAGHAIIGMTATSAASRERVDVMLPNVPILDAKDIVERAELVLLTVPDDAISRVAEQFADRWQMGQVVVHTSGVHGLDVLEPVGRAGGVPLAIHPAMSFSGTSLDIPRMEGVPCAVSAPPVMAPVAQALVMELGGVPITIPGADHPLYHAALTHSASHLIVLIAQAREILASIGIDNPGEILRRLTEAALDSALREGGSALTGPAGRGDAGTLKAHKAALENAANAPAARVSADIIDTYVALSLQAITLAVDTGRITSAQAEACRAALT